MSVEISRGAVKLSKRTAMLTPSPCSCSPSPPTSPTSSPIRNARRCSGTTAAFCSSSPCCISTAHCTALRTLANAASRLSPREPSGGPPCRRTTSRSNCRAGLRTRRVPLPPARRGGYPPPHRHGESRSVGGRGPALPCDRLSTAALLKPGPSHGSGSGIFTRHGIAKVDERAIPQVKNSSHRCAALHYGLRRPRGGKTLYDLSRPPDPTYCDPSWRLFRERS